LVKKPNQINNKKSPKSKKKITKTHKSIEKKILIFMFLKLKDNKNYDKKNRLLLKTMYF
jgi:hypothetical protein